MRKYLLPLLIITIIIQLAIPISVMINRFDTLRTGVEYKFKVAPVDPYDAFRGRYVALRIETGHTSNPKYDDVKKKVAYAIIKNDINGFAYIDSITKEKPKSESCVKGKMQYGTFIMPVDRYYMEEKIAPKAENAYRENVNQNNTYIKTKVKNGSIVIEGLYINDMRIEDYVKQDKSH